MPLPLLFITLNGLILFLLSKIRLLLTQSQ